MRRSGAVIAIALLTACGGSPVPSASYPGSPTVPSPGSSVTPAASSTASGGACPSIAVTKLRTVTATTPLFAVLETRRASVKESEYSGSHDTLALAGFDGYAYLRVAFTPRHVPDISADGGAVPFLQPEAVVASGAIYVIDGAGVVCRVDRFGATQRATTFPITSANQAVDFAVSPDGKQLIAAVLTYPTYSPGPKSYEPAVSGSWELDIELAAAGSTAQVVRHLEKDPSTPFHQSNIVMAGWDSTGPIGVVGSYEGLVGAPGLDGDRWPGDLSVHAVHVGQDGTIGATIGPNGVALGPNGCGLVSLGPGPAVLCETGGGLGIKPQVYVGTSAGEILWSSPSSTYASGGIALSPDGSLMAMDGWLVDKSGSTTPLPTSFRPRGWIDNTTVVGLVTSSATSSLGVVRVSTPGVVADWGFSGQYVGVI